MRAVVLVGGFGTRLRPLTLAVPKQMLPVCGVPMIERVVAHLSRYGVDEAVLSLGYRPDAFTEAYPDARCAGVALHYAVEPEPLDTAGAIRFAALHAGIDETFLVVNGDVLTDLDVGDLVERHRSAGAEGTLHLTTVDDPSRFGVVVTADDGRVTAFVEKPTRGTEPSSDVNAGTYVLEPSVLERIPADRRVSIERETFPAMAAAGTLHAFVSPAYWIDAGTPATYLQAQLDLLEGRRVAIEPVALDDPPTWIEQGVVIGRGAIVSSAVIGAGAHVGQDATVTSSVLLPRAVVGAGATVHRSIVGRAAVIGPRSTVTDLCVLGDGAVVEADAVLCGARVPDDSEVTS